jgi:hypothetical protein
MRNTYKSAASDERVLGIRKHLPTMIIDRLYIVLTKKMYRIMNKLLTRSRRKNTYKSGASDKSVLGIRKETCARMLVPLTISKCREHMV